MIGKPIFKQQTYIESILLVTAWLLGNIWTFKWFIESLKYASVFNLIILGIVFIVLGVQLWRNGFLEIKSATPRFSRSPVLLMLGGEVSAIILKWSINIPQLTLLCFILGSYGLLGLFISKNTWGKGLSIAIISACVIPFSNAFNSGLGFPVRVITAHTVAHILSDLKLGAVSSHDIIIMENGIAQVDLPCSGMKSLWTGTVFLLGATWLEGRKINLSWLLVSISNILFLIIVNVFRVFTLVVVIEVWQQRQIAEVIHLPLGIFGFIVASIFTWLLLQKVPRYVKQKEQESLVDKNYLQKKYSLHWLSIAVVTLGIIGQLHPVLSNNVVINSIDLPQEITTETLSLTKAEKNFFDNSTNPFVEKLRFRSKDLSGSMLIVASSTWQAHHPPELCFLGNGFKVDNMESKFINDSINARWLSLQDGELSATYWFQSLEKTTDDFVDRLWEHITHKNKTWVLVSVLFDRMENPNSSQIKDFTNSIYQTLDRSLNSEQLAISNE